MKRVIAVVSILLMLVCALAGCKEKDPAAGLYGSWEGQIDLSAYLKERIIKDNVKLKETLELSVYPAKVVFTFGEDGTVKRTIDGGFGEETLATLQSELLSGYTAYYTDYLKKNELDMTIAEFEAATGISLERKAAQIAEKKYLEGLVDEIEYNGTFQVQEATVYLGGFTDAQTPIGHIFELKDGKLTLSVCTDPSGFEKAFYPLTLAAVKE